MAGALLINPNLVVQRNDRFTTGVVYMPVGLAYVAAALREAGVTVAVIDAFGAAPRRPRVAGRFMTLGIPPEEVAGRVPPGLDVVFVYANQVINHSAVEALIRAVKGRHPELPVVVLEN
ncbi:MAG: hypothetical protein HQL82_14860, partial [Magnetococcales bacterium]|nr:hypothetical protein [Magnetococcales bacterium]